MANNKLVTIGVVAVALAMFFGFMGWMSYQRHLESQNPVMDIKSDAQFNQELTNSQEPVFIFFYSKKSSNSAKQLPLVERAAKDYQGKVKFLKVSADNLPEIPLSIGIDRVPAMVVVKLKEKTLVGAIGFLDMPELKKLIDDGVAAKPTPPANPNPPASSNQPIK